MGNKSAAAVLDRLQLVYGVKNDNQLGEALLVNRSTLGNWRSRDTVPYTICVDTSEKCSVSLDWLLTGEGPMRRDEGAPAVEAEAPAAPGISPREQAMLELFRSLDEDGQREIQGAAAEKKRLIALEQRLEELAATVAAMERSA
ncbi:Bacteriophage CI repressor helix-turn-helix domain protein [compost metagenome]